MAFVLLSFFLLAVSIYALFKLKGFGDRVRPTCSDFKYWEESQEVVGKYRNLDGDNDGIACENLPRKK